MLYQIFLNYCCILKPEVIFILNEIDNIHPLSTVVFAEAIANILRELHPAVLRAYFWLYIQLSFLVVLENHLGYLGQNPD